MTTRASAADYTGPGPITRRDRHGRLVVEYADGTITVDQPVNPHHPIAHQWLTGTKAGLIATWGTRQAAIDKARTEGTLLGQLTPVTVTTLRGILEQADPDATLVVLTDPAGNLLPGLVPGHVPAPKDDET